MAKALDLVIIILWNYEINFISYEEWAHLRNLAWM